MHSIRFKITAITIVAILTTILCVFGASYLSLYAEHDRSSERMMNLVGQDAGKAVEKYTESIEQSMEMITNIAIDWLDSVVLAENGAIGGNGEPRTPEQIAALDAYMAEYCERVQGTFTSLASHTHGVVSYYYCINPEISENEHGFFFSRVGKTGFERQTPLDARQLDPADIDHTTWYYTPIQRGRPSWIGPYTAHFLDELWTCSYLVPIYKSGTLIGVIGMDIPFATLVEQIDSIHVYRTGYACLLDGDNRILYHPNLPMYSALDELGIVDLAERLKHETGDELIHYMADGEERMLSDYTLSNGMKLLITAPVAEINASWSRLIRIVFIVTGAIILFFAILLLVVMGIITRPLKQLTEASRRLADGDYDVELRYEKKDEVGELTRSFTAMRDQQKQSFEDLNRQIYTDKLTGLANMRYFFSLADAERRDMLEAGRRPAMLYFNLIGMKQYNRQYGFAEGDRMIRGFGDILASRYSGHSLGHISQDHFAVLTDENQVDHSVQAVFEDCAGTLPVSVGVYPDRLEDVSIPVAVDRAKFACDQRRGAYVSGVRWYDNDMLKKGETFRYIIDHLDQALAEGWVKVYYQAIIRSADGMICDEEALSRWIDPIVGFLSPADFIPALEESKLIYKLDLYVVEQVLMKMKRQAEAGLYVVPQSVNLSRMDFDSCDIVEEIRRRVDDAGIERNMITIEITESVIGSDFDFMKAQVERFRSLGFPVWMDDFGSGYSTLDVLQHIHFDLIKFDMRFMEDFDKGDECKVILTELTKMAIGLGVETVCEGVEEKEQVEFLREIGCTRIQGYYYGKPMSFEDMLIKFQSGGDLGFENPEESEYYATLGRINLYDMAVLAGDGDQDDSLRRFFDTLPMAIMEVNGGTATYARCNRSYREFMERVFGVSLQGREVSASTGHGAVFLNAVLRCSRDGNRAIVDDPLDEKTTIHTFMRRVAINPVTGAVAVAVAVLAVAEVDKEGTSFANITRALSSDYVNLYYVDTTTDAFIEYTSDPNREDLAVERRGDDFFNASAKDAQLFIDREDQDYFIKSFTKENMLKTLDEHGKFTLTYRLLMDGVPTYVNMKAVRMRTDKAHIIIGVSNVDAQMRQKEEMARIQAEQITYSRINALMRGNICIYTVDPVTDHYIEYSATSDYAGLGLAKEGDDFFDVSRVESARLVFDEDREKFQAMLTKERVMEAIEKNGLFAFQYKMLLEGKPTYVELKAAMVEERDGPQLIVGVNNIDVQVNRELDYERKLSAARSKANLDALTGMRNRRAFDNLARTLDKQIEEGQKPQFAVVCCLVNGVKPDDEAGNRRIREACTAICRIFKHSPVFRVTEDQFAVIVRGRDYGRVDELLEALEDRSRVSREGTLACGMAKYDGTGSTADVYERAVRDI